MRVREATEEDRAAWDAFADTEGGTFFHYFDWKYVWEARGHQYISLLAENTASEIIGILPVIKQKMDLYSILHSDIQEGGLLLKREISDAERYEAISALLKYVDTNYSGGCSHFYLRENLSSIIEVNEEPTAALLDSGFQFRYDMSTKLPCTFVLELKQPFEDNIWKSLWSRNLRKELNQAKRKGVVVIQDREFSYIEEFIEMLSANYERHGTIPPTREQKRMEINTFRDKAKLFVALLDNRPVVAQLCYYTASACFLCEIGSYVKDTENANILCDMAAIEDACNMGYKFVDFYYTATAGLAQFKEQFKGTRVPFRSYEKRYHSLRTLVKLLPLVADRAWHDKTYLWKKRRKLWDSIVRW